MATNYISKKLSLFLAEQFIESFFEPEPTSIGYVFIGKHNSYTPTDSPEEIEESSKTELQLWRNMIAAKKITGADINMVIRSKLWTSRVFDQYDDEQLYTSLDDFYITRLLAGVYRVYKCLFNNNGALSTTIPSGTGVGTNGIIVNPDGYIWKYMFSAPANKFVSSNYIPVPLNNKGTNQSVYAITPNTTVDGAIYAIKIINAGSGYANTVRTPVAAASATNTLTLNSTADVIQGMFVSGNNIISGTFVDAILAANQIRLSQNTSAAIPSSLNDLTFSTRIVITGDGTGATVGNFTRNVSTNAFTTISLNNYGSNYSYANTIIYGRGSGAILRPVVGPKFGHGSYPARELAANSVMISTIFGKGDASEGGKISTDSSTFRQVGFLRDPHKYGSTEQLNSFTSNNIVSQAYSVSVVPGTTYTLNSMVYQGTNATTNFVFRGRVYDQTATIVRLTQVEGNLQIGQALKQSDDSVSRIALNIQYPELEPLTGDILYAENSSAVTRSPSQAENIRFIINF
jgi:hypothetical protein